MDNSLISIIVPYFNKKEYISETITSVLNQTYQNWELIIIDDCSTDGSEVLLKEYSNSCEKIKYFKNEINSGGNFSRNKGIKNALGDLIIFLDADDLLSEDCLAIRYDYMIKNSELDFCVFTMHAFKVTPGDVDLKWEPRSNIPLKDFLKHKLPWSILQPIWKRAFLIKIGMFDDNLLRLQDVELHTRALLYEDVSFLQVIARPDCFYRIDPNRVNFSNNELLQRYVQSAHMYYNKFIHAADARSLGSCLVVTLYNIYIMILHNYKIRAINLSEMKELENGLIYNTNVRVSFFHRFIFKVGRVFNLLPFHLRGVNFVLTKLILIKAK